MDRERGAQIRGLEVQGMRQSADAYACKLQGESFIQFNML